MKKVIVSFTSYPKRIAGVTKVLDSLSVQTYKPDRIILYLSEEQFGGRKIPIDLSPYAAHGFELRWCRGDMKSHKKYLYALQEYPDNYVITVDDDFYYDSCMVEEFVRNTQCFPGAVLARRSHLMTSYREGDIAAYEKWWGECLHYVGTPRMDLFAVGCGGVLSPPHIFDSEVFHEEYIRKYCPYADDVWLKVMELLRGVPVVQVKTRYWDVADLKYAQNGLCQNVNGNGGNDRQLKNLLELYGQKHGGTGSLIERVFSDGVTYVDEVEQGKMEDERRSLEEWIEEIAQFQNIFIYGAGRVAGRIYQVLKRHIQAERFRAFLVEDVSQNVDQIEGIPVLPYITAQYQDAVCVVGLASQEEQLKVSKKLLETGMEKGQIVCINVRIQEAVYRTIHSERMQDGSEGGGAK